MSLQASCPSCGAPVEFRVDSSLITVCDSCETLVGRGDGKLEDYGKVSDITRRPTPLRLGLAGKFKGKSFVITGHTQLRHAGGGTWDEWYLAFNDGAQWGWLAEAQGRYQITFKKRTSDPVPPVHDLELEERLMIPSMGSMAVSEIGEAEVIAAEGEIPYLFQPGTTYPYADLTGSGRKVATIDGAEDPPTLYIGFELPLERLGIDPTIPDAVAEDGGEFGEVEAAGITCPNCGGTLDLKEPMQAERVACPYCESLLDCNQGNLSFLKKMESGPKPLIPLGSVGKLDGTEYTVIGFMSRMVRYEGTRYIWQEYLLHAPRKPYKWLVHNCDHHWTLGQSVPAGEVVGDLRTALHAGKTYRIFERSNPEVVHVLGEFYWKVSVGDVGKATDFVSPPYMLSREQDQYSGETRKKIKSKEVNWTLGHYITPTEIKNAFNLSDVPTPSGVAPNQPFPHRGIYTVSLCLLGAAVLIILLLFATAARREVLKQTLTFQKTSSITQLVTTKPFNLAGYRNIRITCQAHTPMAGAYLEGALFNNESGKRIPFTMMIDPRKAGLNNRVYSFMSSVPKGEYQMSIKADWLNRPKVDYKVNVTVHQGVPRMRYSVMLIFALSIMPIIIGVMHGTFEARRWSQSDYGSVG